MRQLSLSFIIMFALSFYSQASICGVKIYASKTNHEIKWEDFIAHLSEVDVIAIGEEHGVVEHPKFLSCLISKLKLRKKTALVLEHIYQEDQPLVDEYRIRHPERAAGLGAKLKWWRTGWPSWQTYLPLFEAAFHHKIEIFGGDIKPINQDLEVIDRLFQLNKKKYDEIYSIWKRRLKSVYCNDISSHELNIKAKKQMVRDYFITKKILTLESTNHKVLFYAGRSHANFNTNLISINKPLKMVVISLSGAAEIDLGESWGTNYIVQFNHLENDQKKSLKLKNCQ